MYVCVYKHTHPSPTITMITCLKASEAPKYTENYLGNNVHQQAILIQMTTIRDKHLGSLLNKTKYVPDLCLKIPSIHYYM